jgi:hypothetical protein
MPSANEPLRESDVGIFWELAQRPNPDDLVILPVPAVEHLLASLRQQLGRDLTPEEVEVQRRKAPSIVVSKAVAEKMLAERVGGPAVESAESARRAPTLTSGYNDMPTEPAARTEAAVNVFGQHLFSARNQLVARLRRVIESDELRERLGTLHRKEFDAASALPQAEREAALALARKAIDLYMQEVLILFTGTGDSLRFGDDHAVNYRLVLEVKEIASIELVEEFDVNRECKKPFYNYYVRWLNRFGNHQ